MAQLQRVSLMLCLLLASAFLIDARTFKAARKVGSLERRDDSLLPELHPRTLVYADDDGVIATVFIEPRLPMIVLEDIEHHIESIDCSTNTMLIHFTSTDRQNEVYHAWSALEAFTIVTNHLSCSQKDEHAAWLVSNVRLESSSCAVALTAKSIPMRETTQKFLVDINSQASVLNQRRSSGEKRDNVTASNTLEISSTPTATFTFPSPTAEATGESSSGDISCSFLDTTVLPPDISIVQLLPLNYPEDIELTCRNCSVAGVIELTAGVFSMTPNETETVIDFLQDGYFEFRATDISAMIDLELALLPGFNLLDFTAQLPSIPVLGVVIAGLLEFGLVLDLIFPISVSLNSPVTFKTGFTLSAPPITSIYLNMSEPNASYTSGFSETNLVALPFTTEAEDFSVNFTTGFKPQLVLGAGLGSNTTYVSASGGIGVYIDLPKLVTTVDMVNDVNENCEPATSDTQDGLLRLTQSVEYGGGALWDLGVTVLSGDFGYAGEVPWLSNTTVLPTQCLLWDPTASSFVNATAAFQSSSGSNEDKQNSGTSLRPGILDGGHLCLLVLAMILAHVLGQ